MKETTRFIPTIYGDNENKIKLVILIVILRFQLRNLKKI